MIRSMTGFGKAEAIIGDRKISVEIRSLNSRQLDLSVRLPYYFRPYEAEIRLQATKLMQRGKVDIYINVESDGAQSDVQINQQLFGNYYQQLKKVGAANELNWEAPEIEAQLIAAILRLPDVVGTPQETITEQEGNALTSVVGEALSSIEEFRKSEGGVLIGDILQRVDRIEELLAETAPYEQERIEKIRTRITDEIKKLDAQIDNNRFEQEMIYYVEKLDITEERVRLSNHCKYFRQVATTEENGGRKLNFICQEMGREINTLGSKANEATIQRLVVEMKDELEKIREQLLNIL